MKFGLSKGMLLNLFEIMVVEVLLWVYHLDRNPNNRICQLQCPGQNHNIQEALYY